MCSRTGWLMEVSTRLSGKNIYFPDCIHKQNYTPVYIRLLSHTCAHKISMHLFIHIQLFTCTYIYSGFSVVVSYLWHPRNLFCHTFTFFLWFTVWQVYCMQNTAVQIHGHKYKWHTAIQIIFLSLQSTKPGWLWLMIAV